MIQHMTANTSLPRSLLVLSNLALFLLPISVRSAPTPIDSMTIAADEPLNVILMIGDGMGFDHVELARLVEVGENGSLVMQQLTWNASVATYCADNPITDSAAAATDGAESSHRHDGGCPRDSHRGGSARPRCCG